MGYIEDEYYKCKCGKPASAVPRTCPYDLDVRNKKKECYCCDDCYKDCGDDI